MSVKTGVLSVLAGMATLFGSSIPSDIGGVRQDVSPSSRKKNQSKEEAQAILDKAEAKRIRKAQKKGGKIK